MRGMNTAPITPLKAWLYAATADEQHQLAEAAGTTRQYLYHMSAPESAKYRREAKPELAAAIERETTAMHRTSKGRLPIVYRTDLVKACRECPFAQRCLGDKALAGNFPIVPVQGE